MELSKQITIQEVIESELFKKKYNQIFHELRAEKLKTELAPNKVWNKYYVNTIIRYDNETYFPEFKQLFTECLFKVCKLGANQRRWIDIIGNRIFKETLQELVKQQNNIDNAIDRVPAESGEEPAAQGNEADTPEN